MTGGESTREKTRFEILFFLFQNEKPQHFKDLEYNCSGARNTVKKYLEELKDEGVIEQSLKGRHPYFLTEKGKKYVETTSLKRKLKDQIDRLPVERIKSLYGLIDKLLMKAVSLTVDKVMLEKMLHDFRNGKVSEEKLAEIEKDYAKWKKETWAKQHFFSEEEIEKMALTMLSHKEIEKLKKSRIKWFEKWFGD